MKISLIVLIQFLLLGIMLKGQELEGFEGGLIYSYGNYYESKKDSIREEKKLKIFAEKTGYEIGKRKKGLNECYIKSDTLIIALFGNDIRPDKHYVQIGERAYIENLKTGTMTMLSEAQMEKVFDENLSKNWRDSVKTNKILQRDMSQFKKFKRHEKIKGIDCVKYKWMKNERTYELYWVDKTIKQSESQKLPAFFESIFLDGGLIIKKEAYHKGRIVKTELEQIEKGIIKNIRQAINLSDINLIKLREKEASR